ncbi:Bypass of stop codon protein 6 [Escovopsis weberi]|uniref:Bypass of stop codon protein 6 n=1 Tax=Escovopsis weberi TaxID=150374 RepID=A0A0M8MVP8_ESCWE|nr:Bypass of stop codon protein 6 [Escovopsis weberi]
MFFASSRTGDSRSLSLSVDCVLGRKQTIRSLTRINQTTSQIGLADMTNESSTSNEGDETSSTEIEKWNYPRENILRFATTCFSLFGMGLNDGSIGALLPYIGPYYDVGYTTVSTVFVVPVVGYVISAFLNNWVHERFGQRGVAFLGPFLRLCAFAPLSLHPPFVWLPFLLCFASTGNGIEDGAYNTWVGNLDRANELLGLMHGAYGLGATVGPLVATAMVTKFGFPWYTYFYVMIGANAVGVVFGTTSFWTATGAAYRERRAKENAGKEAIPLSTVLKGVTVWLLAIFLLGYVGTEVSLGGWIPTFMIEVRHVSGFLAGLTSTLFWLGLTMGRVVLGFVTGRVGERLAIIVYLVLCIVSQCLYWLVPSFVVSMGAVTSLGFFMGPLFPATIVVATKLLPAEHHISAIGFAAAIGSGGAAILPFIVGAIAQNHGVEVLQPIVVMALVFILSIWLSLPSGPQKSGSDSPGDAPEGGLMQTVRDLFGRCTGRRGYIRLEDDAV